MKKRCKVGDMAIVVGTPGMPVLTPGIIGRVVEIMRPHVAGSNYRAIDGNTMHSSRLSDTHHWVVRSSIPLPWGVFSGPNAGSVWMFEERPISDSSLRPISGVPVNDKVTDDLEVTA
jgi:hypothetical protein